MESTGSRRRAGSGIRNRRRRGRLHVGCGVAGLFASAGWGLSVVSSGPAPATGAEWWSLANLFVCAVLVVFGQYLQRSKRALVLIDCACTVLTLTLVVAWIGIIDGTQSWLVGLLPALIVAHFASGGRGMGTLAWVASSLLYVGLAWAPRFNAQAGNRVSFANEEITSQLGGLAPLTAAALLGWSVSRTPRRRGRSAPVQPTAPPLLATGTLVAGRYRLGELIGEGAMGRVFEAERIEDGMIVALKILHSRLSLHSEAMARFRREVEIAARLPPDHIAAVLDFGNGAGVEYIAMERLRGEDLGARLQRVKRLSPEGTAEVVDQIASVLDAAAGAGVVHRDVQPRNIFLVEKPDGAIDTRLLDFGIARLGVGEHRLELTRAAAVLGTAGYLAPEQVSVNLGEVGPHTDVFALGCVAYFALSGHRAFEARDPAQGSFEVLNHHPLPVRDRVPELPESIDAVLSLALAKRPENRYRTAGDFARDLKAAVNGELSTRVAKRAVAIARGQAAPAETLST